MVTVETTEKASLRPAGADKSQPNRSAAADNAHTTGGLTGDFRAMLAATCDVSRAVDASLNSTASPAQMFESFVSDPDERRQRSLEEEYRADLAQEGLGKLTDSTSVQARRAAGMERWSLDSRGVFARDSEFVAELRSTNVASSDAKAGRSWFEDALPSGKTMPVGDRGERAWLRASGLHGAHRAESAEPAPLDSKAESVAPLSAATPGAGIVRVSGQQQGDAAQRIAQILTSSRAGGAEAARAPGALPAGQDAQSQARQQSGTRTTSQGERANSQRQTFSSPESGATKESEFNRLVRSIQLRGGKQNSSARIRLSPPELGRIQVDVRLEGDHLQIGVRAETLEARELLTQRAGQLHSALEQHGINVERFDVTVDFLGNDAPEKGEGNPLGFAWSSQEQGKSGYGSTDQASEVSSPDAMERVDAEDEAATVAAGDTRLDIRI